MSIVFVRKITDGSGDYEVGKGVSPYTPYTTHYDIDDASWTLPLTVNAIRGSLIYAKIKGTLPPKSKLPYPPIKRKL